MSATAKHTAVKYDRNKQNQLRSDGVKPQDQKVNRNKQNQPRSDGVEPQYQKAGSTA